MKKNYFLSFILVFIFSIYSFSQVSIGNGTNVNEELPIEPYYGYTYSQSIYSSTLINAAGSITGVKYFATEATTLETSSEWVVYIGTTENTEFETTDSWVDLSQLSLVYNDQTNIAEGVVSITFDTPFEYDGTSNIVVAVEENQQGYDSSNHDFFCTPSSSSVSLTYYSDSNNPDPTKISIEITDRVYRVIYWDGYAVNEYYDYQNFNKALKKFRKFSDKALTNIKKFGIK